MPGDRSCPGLELSGVTCTRVSPPRQAPEPHLHGLTQDHDSPEAGPRLPTVMKRVLGAGRFSGSPKFTSDGGAVLET